jgi:carbon-monoxide dehydrogenase iron sulfur subunit
VEDRAEGRLCRRHMESEAMMRIVLDPAKCVGCRVCEGICSLVNEGEANPVKSRIKVVRTVENQLLYTIPVFCQQCEEAYCEGVCPTHAIAQNEDGVKIVNEGKCIGCKLCEIACPVGAITVIPDKHVSIKCDQCAILGGAPQCVKHCFAGALQFMSAEKTGMARARAKSDKFLEMAKRD